MSDDNLSQREKRRQQHEANKPAVNLNAGALKQWAWPIGLVVVIGGVAGLIALTESSAPDCPGHWHNAYSVFVDGERIPFDEQAYTVAANNVYAPGTHIHADDGVYHWHPAVEKCGELSEGLQFLGVTFSGSTMTLDESHADDGFQGTYTDVRMFQQKWSDQDDEWVEVTNFGKVLSKQPKDGDGVVFLAGTYTDAEVEEILANQAVSMKGNPSYDPHYEPTA